ncbi:MAG: BrnT family toxin [Gammaproteobacteria bacterium]|mgnify:CR=1 FL=1|nr:BrnT family toxin [Gammaproteobacteria bacterium]
MNFEWDEHKSDACLLERGFDFAYAASAFADPDRIIRQDTRYSYGEDRYQLIGRIGNRLFVLVYTPRQGVVRVISARKANAREVKRYENRSHED